MAVELLTWQRTIKLVFIGRKLRVRVALSGPATITPFEVATALHMHLTLLHYTYHTSTSGILCCTTSRLSQTADQQVNWYTKSQYVTPVTILLGFLSSHTHSLIIMDSKKHGFFKKVKSMLTASTSSGFFKNAKHVTVTGGTFNQVHGDVCH